MGLSVDLLEASHRNMRVHLRGGQILVAKQFLHDAQVSTPGQEVRGERMAQRVRMNVVETGPSSMFFNDLPDDDARNGATRA